MLQSGKLDLCREDQGARETWTGGQTECTYQGHMALSAVPSVQEAANLLILLGVGWPNIYIILRKAWSLILFIINFIYLDICAINVATKHFYHHVY